MRECTKYCTPTCHWHEARKGLINSYFKSIETSYSNSDEIKRLEYVVNRNKQREELWNSIVG